MPPSLKQNANNNYENSINLHDSRPSEINLPNFDDIDNSIVARQIDHDSIKAKSDCLRQALPLSEPLHQEQHFDPNDYTSKNSNHANKMRFPSYSAQTPATHNKNSRKTRNNDSIFRKSLLFNKDTARKVLAQPVVNRLQNTCNKSFAHATPVKTPKKIIIKIK